MFGQQKQIDKVFLLHKIDIEKNKKIFVDNIFFDRERTKISANKLLSSTKLK